MTDATEYVRLDFDFSEIDSVAAILWEINPAWRKDGSPLEMSGPDFVASYIRGTVEREYGEKGFGSIGTGGFVAFVHEPRHNRRIVRVSLTAYTVKKYLEKMQEVERKYEALRNDIAAALDRSL